MPPVRLLSALVLVGLFAPAGGLATSPSNLEGVGTANTVTPIPDPGACISTGTPCITIPFKIERADSEELRGFSVTFTLSPELTLCSGLASITEGTYLSGAGGTEFLTIDNSGGSYTADGAILGLPCGATAPAGILFDVGVKASAGDGTGTITITSVIFRDCDNAPLTSAAGTPASVPIDTAGPTAVNNLAAAQVKTGNDSDGTTKITLTFAAPGDAVEMEVYRAPFSDLTGVNAYPEYDDVPNGGEPPTPSYPPPPPWVLTPVTVSGQTDETASRGFWYFAAFSKDACGNVSAVSNVTDGTLNYHLGDVSDGITPGQGDNLVGTADISLLGAFYSIEIDFGAAVNYLDVGPTTDLFVNSLPTTDDLIQFEDLILFAINYGAVSAPRAPSGSQLFETPLVSLELAPESVIAGEVVEARLLLRDNADVVKGAHVEIAAPGLELLSARRGSLLSSQADPVFFKDLETPGGVSVDLAVLGGGKTLSGDGELAVLTLRAVEPGARPELVSVDLRGPANRRVSSALAGEAPSMVAGEFSLLGARPNPFRGSTEIVFRIPDRRSASLTIYDVSGRLVRRLADGLLEAGEHRMVWDGRTSEDIPASAGIYFYTLQTENQRETQRLLHIR